MDAGSFANSLEFLAISYDRGLISLDLHIFNTLTEKKDKVAARDGKTFRMFVCGPTVQDNMHVGHAKTYIAYDVLARWLLRKGIKVLFLLNITDIDDKIFDRAKRESVPYMKIADRFFNEFLADIRALNIVTVSKIERVSKYIEEAIQLVQTLVSRRKAYELAGNVYFDTSKADRFGKLSHQSRYQLQLKQIDAAPGKRNSVDFLLWRRIENAMEGLWPSPYGEGRPGWHIEDSVIAFEALGGAYDLHGGATELIFPHHEAELAQDEAASGEIPFVSIWMHTGLLLKGGEKMSKSLGNVVTIKDALKSFTADEVRYYFLSHHYKESFEFDLEDLSKSREGLAPILQAARIVGKKTKAHPGEGELEQRFLDCMEDDLNTPKALALLVKLSREIVEGRSRSPKSDYKSEPFWYMVESLGFKLF
jgi:cysteinyl-tRNA synthetase